MEYYWNEDKPKLAFNFNSKSYLPYSKFKYNHHEDRPQPHRVIVSHDEGKVPT